MRALSALLLGLVLLLPARVWASSKAVVMPLDPKGQKLSDEERRLLNEAIFSVSGEALSGRGYTVMDSDAAIRELQDNDYSLEKICDTNCALDAARELKAAIVVSGSVMVAEGRVFIILRTLDRDSGRQLGSVDIESEGVRTLKKAFLEKSATLFERVPPAPGFTPKVAMVRVEIETRPSSATVKVDGKLACGTQRPCHVEVIRGDHLLLVEADGYVPSSEIQLLKESGTIQVRLQRKVEERRSPRYAVRLGWGGLNGIVGLGGEVQLTDDFSLPLVGHRGLRMGLGTGTHALTGGLSLAPPGMQAGVYVDLHMAWVRPGVFGGDMVRGVGFGASAGYDFRPLSWLSVKAGLGLAWSSANTGRTRPLVLDLAVGPVF